MTMRPSPSLRALAVALAGTATMLPAWSQTTTPPGGTPAASASTPMPTPAPATTSPAPAAGAPATTATAPNEQVVVPQVERREVRLPKFPSNDWELGVFAGTYSAQNFGSSPVGGLRLGYHVTEDVFVEGAFATTTVSDESFRQILPGGVFVDETERLTYYSLSAGYNLLPGEVFLGRRTAKASQLFLIGGVGSTDFAGQRRQTFNFGLGLRLFFNDKVAMRVDVRDHVYSLDLLGKSQTTQNLELTAGVSYLF